MGLSLVSVVCCQLGVSASGSSLVQRSPIDSGASLSVIQKPGRGRPSPLEAVAPYGEKRAID
jgi:hypothetical protein